MSRKITYFEIKKEIVPSLIEDLRSLPDQSRITLEELISDSSYADYYFTDNDMSFLQRMLYSQASREKIWLDHCPDGSLVVHNMDAKYICPNCGSVNTAHIQWGYPIYTPQLKKKLASGTVRLGGCCIIPYGPDRYCNDCGHEFLTRDPWYSYLLLDTGIGKTEMGNKLPENPVLAESFTYKLNYPENREVIIQVEHTPDGSCIVLLEGRHLEWWLDYPIFNEISEDCWKQFIGFVYSYLKFHEWDPSCSQTDEKKEKHWEITVQFPDNVIQKREGYDPFPDCLHSLDEIMTDMLTNKGEK